MKRPSISSYHQNGGSAKPSEKPRMTIRTCPECGRKSMEIIRGDYLTPKGYLILDLERYQCLSCKAEMFDTEAMTRIIKEGTLAAKPSRRTPTIKNLEPNNA